MSFTPSGSQSASRRSRGKQPAHDEDFLVVTMTNIEPVDDENRPRYIPAPFVSPPDVRISTSELRSTLLTIFS